MAFTAEYHGPCGDCESDVKGSTVRYDGHDRIVHVVCPDPTAAKRAVCGGCQMELPVSGICGVC